MPHNSSTDKEPVTFASAQPRSREDRLTGVLLGMALGDALGLPYEGLSRRRVSRWGGDGPLRHRFLLGRGMCSDDTEHACMVGQALLASGSEPAAFARSLGWRLRGWLAALPAGVGLATLRAICRLWVGIPPAKSGVFSAGNGPAMRAPVLGACWGHQPSQMLGLLQASTRLTHSDPKAYHGALLIARATWAGMQHEGAHFDAMACWRALQESIEEPELRALCAPIGPALEEKLSCHAFAEAMGLGDGVTGYTYHTVPVSLYCWLRAPLDPVEALASVIALGGDTDTTGAIVGGMVGATVGADQLPQPLLDGICEWPRSISWIRRLGKQMAHCIPAIDVDTQPGELPDSLTPSHQTVPLWWPGILLRNAFFLVVVLLHGFRRLFPPY